MSKNKGKKALQIIILCGVILAVIFVAMGLKSDEQTLSVIGAGIFIVTVITVLFIENVISKSNSDGKISSETEKTALKYEPLLLDERTKQDPEVQRLLQYPTVQKVFFDPEFLKTAAAQSDPYVRELLAVLDNIIAVRTAEGTYPPDPKQTALNGNSAYANILMQREKAQREKEKNKPRRIAGTVLMFTGLALFIVPFSTVFIAAAVGSELAEIMSSFLFTAAPIGMALIVIGKIVKK